MAPSTVHTFASDLRPLGQPMWPEPSTDEITDFWNKFHDWRSIDVKDIFLVLDHVSRYSMRTRQFSWLQDLNLRPWFDRAAILMRAGDAYSEALINVANNLTKLKIAMPDGFCAAWQEACIKKMKILSPKNLSQVLSYPAILGAPLTSEFLREWQIYATKKYTDFNAKDMVFVLQGLSILELSSPAFQGAIEPIFVNDLWTEMLKQAGHLTSNHNLIGLCALATGRHIPSEVMTAAQQEIAKFPYKPVGMDQDLGDIIRERLPDSALESPMNIANLLIRSNLVLLSTDMKRDNRQLILYTDDISSTLRNLDGTGRYGGVKTINAAAIKNAHPMAHLVYITHNLASDLINKSGDVRTHFINYLNDLMYVRPPHDRQEIMILSKKDDRLEATRSLPRTLGDIRFTLKKTAYGWRKHLESLSRTRHRYGKLM